MGQLHQVDETGRAVIAPGSGQVKIYVGSAVDLKAVATKNAMKRARKAEQDALLQLSQAQLARAQVIFLLCCTEGSTNICVLSRIKQEHII